MDGESHYVKARNSDLLAAVRLLGVDDSTARILGLLDASQFAATSFLQVL